MTITEARTVAVEVPIGLTLADLTAQLEDPELAPLCRENVKAHEEIIADIALKLPAIRKLEETVVDIAIAAERLPREWSEFSDVCQDAKPDDRDIKRTWHKLRKACDEFTTLFNTLLADMDAFEETPADD